MITKNFKSLQWITIAVVILSLGMGSNGSSQQMPAGDAQQPQAATTVRVSVSSAGVQANHYSIVPALSADGRFVSFTSRATNLISGDTNNVEDIFVHDLQTHATERVSVSSGEAQANSSSSGSSISADGRYVAFESYASNLGEVGNSYGYQDIYVRDRTGGNTELISVAQYNWVPAYGNSKEPFISRNGRYVSFTSVASNLVEPDGNNLDDVFLFDRTTDQMRRISRSASGGDPNSSSQRSSVSDDGRFVAFDSTATNFGTGDDPNLSDVFVRDTVSGTLELISIGVNNRLANGNSFGSAISADGRFVAFGSHASNLVPVDNNRCVVTWGGPLESCPDIFVRDRQLGVTELVSVSTSGLQGNKPASPYRMAISPDGRYVAFASQATNLVPGDTNGFEDLFVHDRQTHITRRINLTSDGSQIEMDTQAVPHISADGSVTAFATAYASVVPGDTNNRVDVFARSIPISQAPDLSIAAVDPIQSLAGQTLVKNKPIGIRVLVVKTGQPAVDDVQASVALDGNTFPKFFLDDDLNRDPQNRLILDNLDYPLDFPEGDSTASIYFFSEALTPLTGTYQVSATVDPANAIAEEYEDNNSLLSAQMVVSDTLWTGATDPNLYVHYFRADWGATPLGDFTDYVQKTDNFIKGVFPLAPARYTSLSSPTFIGDTSHYTNTLGLVDQTTLGNWVRDTLATLRLAHPTADRFVATFPQGWFFNETLDMTNWGGCAYPSMRGLVVVEARGGARPNGLSIVPHELAHSYGLDLTCEEYNACNPTRLDNIGNPVDDGLWVEEKMPVTFGDGRKIYCFMGSAGDLEYWIDPDDYKSLFDSHQGATPPTPRAQSGAVLAVGSVDISGTVSLQDWYEVPVMEPDDLPAGEYAFKYLDSQGATLSTLPFDVDFSVDNGALLTGTQLTQASFVFAIPIVPNAAKIQVMEGQEILAEKVISANSPHVTLINPAGGSTHLNSVTIEWTGSDLDGDSLTYTLQFSRLNDEFWEPIATGLSGSSFIWDVRGLEPGTRYAVAVIASDGYHTARVTSDEFTIETNRLLFLPFLRR